VLDALWVLLTELLRQRVVILLLEGKASLRKDFVFLDDLIENIDVEG